VTSAVALSDAELEAVKSKLAEITGGRSWWAPGDERSSAASCGSATG
jgi:hypothetical protein